LRSRFALTRTPALLFSLGIPPRRRNLAARWRAQRRRLRARPLGNLWRLPLLCAPL